MPVHRTISASLLACGVLLLAAASVKAADTDAISDSTKRQIAQNPDRFIESAVQRLYQIGPDGIATQEGLERYRRMELAKKRATYLNQLLSMDLDGNGDIDSGELDDLFATKSASEKARFEVIRLETDTDKDGTIDFEELMVFASRKAVAAQQAIQDNDRYNPLLFDEDGDGKVDAAEIARRVRAIAAAPLPSSTSAYTANAPAIRREPPKCDAPKPAAGDEVVLLSAGHGSGVSTVAVNGPNAPTTVATITIEKGNKPLYVFAVSGGGVIWKVDGRIDRIAKFVVQPSVYSQDSYPGAGVVGLDPKVVVFVDSAACIKPFTAEGQGAAIIAKSTLTAQLNHPIDHIVAANQPYSLGIPSGIAPPTNSGRKGTVVIVGDSAMS